MQMLVECHVADDAHNAAAYLGTVLVQPVEPLQQLQAAISHQLVTVRRDLQADRPA